VHAFPPLAPNWTPSSPLPVRILPMKNAIAMHALPSPSFLPFLSFLSFPSFPFLPFISFLSFPSFHFLPFLSFLSHSLPFHLFRSAPPCATHFNCQSLHSIHERNLISGRRMRDASSRLVQMPALTTTESNSVLSRLRSHLFLHARNKDALHLLQTASFSITSNSCSGMT
jgi:hypothetical protein